MSPVFSIIVPSYNRAEFLYRTLDSISKQTFKDFELLIVDDGSKDNTKDVVEQLAAADLRIHYIFQPNAERGAARNNGIRNAKGEFIIFFDSDDEMRSDYLEKLDKAIQQQPNYSYYAAKYIFSQNGKEFPSTISFLKEGAYDIELVLKGNPFACNFCIRNNNQGLKYFCEDRLLATTEDWMFLIENLYTQSIYLFDFTGLVMHQHDFRSMQQNKMLIERRLKATHYLEKQLSFRADQKKVLWAYTNYFCSVHAYLDCQRAQSIRYIKKSIWLIGPRPLFLKALAKYIIGRPLILKLVAQKG